MTTHTKQLLKEALVLPAVERAGMADKLLSSLDTPDKSLDKIWAGEIDDRINAYRCGKMETVAAEEVHARYLLF